MCGDAAMRLQRREEGKSKGHVALAKARDRLQRRGGLRAALPHIGPASAAVDERAPVPVNRACVQLLAMVGSLGHVVGWGVAGAQRQIFLGDGWRGCLELLHPRSERFELAAVPWPCRQAWVREERRTRPCATRHAADAGEGQFGHGGEAPSSCLLEKHIL